MSKRELRKLSEKTEGGVIETIGDNARAQLRAYARRIESLEDDKANIQADMKEVYAEAKSDGFDTTILRKAISRRKKDRAQLMEEEAMLEMYEAALEGDLARGDEQENYDDDE